MKILVLTNLYPPHAVGGYEERCRDVIEGLRERGHEVRVLTSTHGVNGEEKDGLVHRRLWIHGFYGHPWRSILSLFQLERHNHKVLREEIAEFGPEVVHVWNMGGLSKALLLTLQESGLPVVYDVSDHWIARSLRADVWLRWWNGDTGGAGARLLRALLRGTGLASSIRKDAPYARWEEIRFERIYFCSDFLRRITAKAGYAVEHGAVIYCGVETSQIAVRPEGDDFRKLLFAGRLSADKDPLTAIRAMGVLRSRGETTLQLFIYGKGDADYVAHLQAAAAELGVADAVTFGAVTRAEMQTLFAAHDALIFTSAWGEPFALTPLEAMAAGVPTICTLEGGSAELIRHEVNALAFATGDAGDLAERILWLKARPVERAKIAAEGKREVRARFGRGTMVDEIEAYLRGSVAHV